MNTADILRQKFLDYFLAKKHKIVASDSLVPHDDPTVLFTSAGMNQFKKNFLGLSTALKRAASSQRCLRTDDLDKVGKTLAHHTFFEMLGNFSFGDYFKAQAIPFAWEFLTDVLKIDKQRLWVSVYKDDDEAYQIWKGKIKIPEDKIVKLGDKENFWPSEAKAKGPNGPCGPCSEIFFDFGEELGCGKPDCSPACDCNRFVEIWNLVFTQYNRKPDGSLEPLPRKNIDTGMGLERLTAVMQGVHSNFQTDLFKPLCDEIRRNAKLDNKELVYAIADHVRAVAFAIYDGVLPSNEERGYVVRKIIRKSAFDARNLGIEKPFLYKLVPIVALVMKEPYPGLTKRRENIAQIILAEEKSFAKVLKGADDRFFTQKFASGSAENAFKTIPVDIGNTAFELYDTYGIPYEVTDNWLKSKGMGIPKDIFMARLNQQKELSKSRSSMKGDVFSASGLKLKVKQTKFTGYDSFEAKARIIGVINEADKVKIILNQTPFYAESGGQIGDTGKITKKGTEFQVLDTQEIDKVIIHIGRLVKGKLKKGDSVLAGVDRERRLSIMRNHTATHILQAVLRKVLGEHVQQQGSLVADQRFRFDFTHFQDVSDSQLCRIEEMVNDLIRQDDSLKIKELDLHKAKQSGALAFFGEKYEDEVRVVSIDDYSKELCGGTHLSSTGQIGLFKIINEGSIASGVRRIEAVTGSFAYKQVKIDEGIVLSITEKLKIPKEKTLEALDKLLSELKNMQRKSSTSLLKSFEDNVNNIINEAINIKDTLLIIKKVSDADMNMLRSMADFLRLKFTSGVFILGSTVEGKVFLVLGVSDDLVKRGIDAVKLIKEIALIVDGSGGGRANFAQAGGNNPARLDEALNKIKELI